MRFLADGMLGRLTRWLRMMGHDVEYASRLDDAELIQRAGAEGRTLLTRDVELYRRAAARGLDALLVGGGSEAERLAELAERFHLRLEIDVAVSRCPKCNTMIRPAPPEEVADRVPRGTASRYREFWECPGCGQVYWRGSHWRQIERTLREAERALESHGKASSPPR